MDDKKKPATGSMKAGKPGKPHGIVRGGLMKHPNVMNLGGQSASSKRAK